VADPGRLVEAASRFHLHLPDAFVLEQHPALEDVDELHFDVVRVPFAVRRLAGACPDHVRDYLAAARALDPEVAVLEVAAQAPAAELRAFQVADLEPRPHRPGILR
jgi:hypothetical protein